MCGAVFCGVVYVLVVLVAAPAVPSGAPQVDTTAAVATKPPRKEPRSQKSGCRSPSRPQAVAADRSDGGEPVTLGSLLRSPGCRALLLCKACISLAFFLLTGTFDLYLAQRFQME